MATKGVELASAYISLGISVDDVPEQVEKALKKVDARRPGQRVGKQFSDGMGSEMSTGGTRVGKAMSTAVAGAAGAGMGSAGKDAARKFNTGFQSEAEARGTRVGTAIGTVIGKSIGGAISLGIGGAATLAAGAVAGLGYTLNKGFQRLKKLDDAKFKLQALGHSAADVEKIMESAEKSVKGTSFALDEAASSAASAVAAGLKPGAELTKYLTTISDTAAIAGTSFGEMASIFNKVTSNNKAYTDDLQMLADRGVPIFQYLRQQFGVTAEELQKMVEDGKVSSADFARALETNLGGAAKKMGESLSGALANFEAAIGRLGAKLLDPVFNNAAGSFTSLTGALDNIGKWVDANQDKLIDFWVGVGNAALTAAERITLGAADITNAIADMMGGLGNTLGAITKVNSGIQRALGREEIADQLLKDAEGYFAWGEGLQEVSDELRRMSEGMGTHHKDIDSWGEETKQLTQFTKDLGAAIAQVSGEDVILKAPTADDLNKIDEAKYRIEQIPETKDFKLIPNTAEAEAAMNAWREKQENAALHIGARAGTQLAEQEMGAWRTDEEGNPVRVPVDPETDSANAEMQAFIDQWTKGITIPVSVGPPGSHTPGQNPLDIFAPDRGRPQGIRGSNAGMGAGSVPMSGGVGGRMGAEQAFFGPGASGMSPAAQRAVDTAIQEARGQAYDYGGAGQNGRGYDCSGIVSKIYSAATGRQVRFTTESDFAALGFIPGNAPGALNIGVSRGGGGPNSHMAATLPNGINVESGGAHGTTAYGGAAAGASSFPLQWHLPLNGYATGGAALGPGTGKSDSIPAYLSNGEHVLTAAEVAMMGGQSGVYAFRNALHRNTGGEVDWLKGERKRTPGWVPRGNFNPNMKIDTSMASSSGAPWYYKMLTEGLGVEPFMTERVGSAWHMGRLLDLISGGAAGYRGDVSKKHPVWPPMRFAQGGAISLDILKRLQESGGLPTGPIPPEAMQSLQAGAQAFNAKQQGFGSEITQAGRTEGYIPAGAGFTGKTGGGLAGGLLQMGAEAVKGAIDMAASAGSGMFPGAGAAFGMGAQAAKRGVDWAAEMGGIGIGAITEIFTPFGAPRWLTDVDPTSFMPQMGVQPAAVTSGEQAMQNEVAQQQGLPPGVQAGADAFRAKAGMSQAFTPHPGTPPPITGQGMPREGMQPPFDLNNPASFLSLFGFKNGGAVYDSGGILKPNSIGLNLSNRPEYVLPQKQWKAMEANASSGAAGGITYNITANGFSPDEVARDIVKRQKLAVLQHSGRPSGG